MHANDLVNGTYVTQIVTWVFLQFRDIKDEKFSKEFRKGGRTIAWIYDSGKWDYYETPFYTEFSGAPRGGLYVQTGKDPNGSSIKLFYEFRRHLAFLQAQNGERAGRHEQAAQLYEQYDLYDKAGELREEARGVRVKATNVSVNLNKLLEQVKAGALVVEYRCPHCSGNLKIEEGTRQEGLRFCSYCGSEIDIVDLVKFLKSALS